MTNGSRVRPVNIFYGHVMLGLTCLVFQLWGTTQYVAYSLGFQPQLGNPLFLIKGIRFYVPWAWFSWAYSFESYAPSVFDKASWITYVSFFLMFFLMLVLAIRRAKQKRSSGAYGTARWAETKELKAFGIISSGSLPEGVVLAQTYDAGYRSETGADNQVRWVMTHKGKHILVHNGPEHVFIFAPTRSGKGVGIVIPTLVNWFRSAIIIDIKKELWFATAGFRNRFSHCLRFEPTTTDSVRFNPLMEIRRGNYEVRDAQNIADILVDPEGAKEYLDHWEKTGHSLLVGAILLVLYSEKNKSLEGVANFLSNPNSNIFATLTRMQKTPHLGAKPHPVVARCAREMLNKSENELSGVVSTAMSFLSLYRDPIIAQNTSRSDFKIMDLMNSRHPISLYIIIPPSDLDRTRPLIRLMLNQIGRRLTESMFQDHTKDGATGPESYKHRLLLLMDEFPVLGRLNFFETELAYLAGYGIKCVLIAQSLNQIEKAYGQNNSILDNSHIRITFGALDERTAKRISDLLGQATEYRRQLNFAGNRLAPWLGHLMASEQESPRQLLTQGEILQLPGDDALIMIGNMPPYRAKKIMFYQDDRFKYRVNLPCPESILRNDNQNNLPDYEELFPDEKGMQCDETGVSHEKLISSDPYYDSVDPDPEEQEKDMDIFESEIFFDDIDQTEERDISEDRQNAIDQHLQFSNKSTKTRIRAIDLSDEGDLPL
ncbi:TRAG family protein [uncultured Desulfobacterium sp.]|uniref:TRAG family protein n=1 Tax=uncultured Desulfobacterium sp. TaxID=201089 RepID=A0A445MSK7_9BACT|nr:TRAG family protein [uncultured Desulfobacterium sp.]